MQRYHILFYKTKITLPSQIARIHKKHFEHFIILLTVKVYIGMLNCSLTVPSVSELSRGQIGGRKW